MRLTKEALKSSLGATYLQAGGAQEGAVTARQARHELSAYFGARMFSGGLKGGIKSPISLCTSEDAATAS